LDCFWTKNTVERKVWSIKHTEGSDAFKPLRAEGEKLYALHSDFSFSRTGSHYFKIVERKFRRNV
jgi:hypothetical protein